MFTLPKCCRFLGRATVLVAYAAMLCTSPLVPVADAQQRGADDEPIEEIITTGTRRAERSASDSAVPIDVIGGQELVNIGTNDLNELLRNTVPSYNV